MGDEERGTEDLEMAMLKWAVVLLAVAQSYAANFELVLKDQEGVTYTLTCPKTETTDQAERQWWIKANEEASVKQGVCTKSDGTAGTWTWEKNKFTLKWEGKAAIVLYANT